MLSHFESLADRVSFAVLTVVLLGLCAATIGSAATQIGKPWPGFVVWRNLVAPAIGGPNWPGSQSSIPARQVVVAIDGTPVATADALRALVRAGRVGEEHRYTFRRGALSSEAPVRSTVLRWRDVLPVYLPYWIDGLAFFAAGLIVFYFRPRLPAARAALALGTSLGSVLLLASDVFSAFWLDRLYFICESLTPAALLHFALCFPEEKALVRRHRWLPMAVYLPFLPLALLQVLALDGSPERHLVFNDLAYTAMAGAGLVSVASLVHTFLSSSSALARQQAKIVMAGVALAALPPSFAILSIILFGADVPMNLLAPFYIVYPLSIGYAIARHDLFSVDRYLRTGVVYAALSLLVFVTYAALVLVGESWLGRGSLPSLVVPLYLVLVLVLFDPARTAIQTGVDRLFFRQAYSYRATVEATSRSLASVLDSERVAATVLDTLTQAMAIDWALLIVIDGERGAHRCFARPVAKVLEVGSLLAAPGSSATLIAAVRGGRRTRYDGHGRNGGATTTFDALDPALVLPLRFESEPVGLLLLGDKKSGAFYTDDDLQLLGTLVNQTALALNNARAYEIIRRTQAELVEAERLAAVGELASTVAHGIRNPLAGIRAAAQVAREDVADDSSMGESLDDIISEADRLERRIRSILDLVRPASSDAAPGDVDALLRSFVAALAARVPPGMTIELDLAPDVPRVEFDPTQLTEALDILVVNAFEATKGRGRVVVRARVDPQATPPDMALVSVTDDGPGIDAARIGRIFELFYTTKPSGTGVGLAMAKRLIERQRGTIAVASIPGQGTTFTMRLPLAAGVARADSDATAR